MADNVDNCPNWYNPSQNLPVWPVPSGDPDCDGFTTAIENYIGTDPASHCAATDTANDEPPPDVWPVDMNDDQRVSLADVLAYSPVFNTRQGVLPPPDKSPYDPRFDLNMDARISLADVLGFSPFFNQKCAAASPSPTPTPTLMPTATPTPTPTPTPSP